MRQCLGDFPFWEPYSLFVGKAGTPALMNVLFPG